MSVLREAYELIRDPERWCTGTLARAADGSPVDARIPEAASWCALGAVFAQSVSVYTGKLQVAGAAAALEAAAFELFDQSVSQVNDHLGHEAVCQMYEKAIVQTDGGL